MKDIVHGSLLVESIFENTSEKVGKSFYENSIVKECVEIHNSLVLKGLSTRYGVNMFNVNHVHIFFVGRLFEPPVYFIIRQRPPLVLHKENVRPLTNKPRASSLQ